MAHNSFPFFRTIHCFRRLLCCTKYSGDILPWDTGVEALSLHWWKLWGEDCCSSALLLTNLSILFQLKETINCIITYVSLFLDRWRFIKSISAESILKNLKSQLFVKILWIYQKSLRMSPFEAFYGRSCNAPIGWSDIISMVFILPDMLEDMEQEM